MANFPGVHTQTTIKCDKRIQTAALLYDFKEVDYHNYPVNSLEAVVLPLNHSILSQTTIAPLKRSEAKTIVSFCGASRWSQGLQKWNNNFVQLAGIKTDQEALGGLFPAFLFRVSWSMDLVWYRWALSTEYSHPLSLQKVFTTHEPLTFCLFQGHHLEVEHVQQLLPQPVEILSAQKSGLGSKDFKTRPLGIEHSWLENRLVLPRKYHWNLAD